MISEYLGVESDYVIIGLAGLVLLLFLLVIINMAQISGLKKRYRKFMTGRKAKSLEDVLAKRLKQIEDLIEANNKNETDIQEIEKKMKYCYQKVGVVKYDAFNEMGGKLSFSMALLNEANDGFIINAMHSREGCFTYIKDIVGGNSIMVLSHEEEEALEIAKKSLIHSR